MQAHIKKIVSALILILLMSFVSMPSVNAADDITGHYAEKEMRALNEKGIMKGDSPGTFSPDRAVTRAEFSAFVKRALELDLPIDPSTGNFSDVEPDDWFYDAVNQTVAASIITGYPEGDFRPNQKITREEMAVIMYRALQFKGIEMKEISLGFKDKDQILKDFIDEISMVASVKLISGYPDNTYRPKDNTKRADAAIVIYRMLNIISPPPILEYSVANITSDGELKEVKKYETYNDAKNALTSPSSQVVMKGKKIVWMKSGLTISNGFTIIYDSTKFTSNYTYVTTGTEMQFHSAGETWVEVTIADTRGYVKKDSVSLTPYQMLQGRSYYSVSSGSLYHYIYSPTLNRYSGIVVGKAPSFMTPGTKYFSWDGNEFYNTAGNKAGQAYQYYQYLPLYTKTKYTAEQLDSFIRNSYPDAYKSKFPTSPLEGTGEIFKRVEDKYGVNALYFLSHAIHESAWGTSRIAVDKYNLFGLGAVDSDPYGNAITFESLEAGIEEAAVKYIIPKYFTESNPIYHGAFLGNKTMGMNVKYASDPYWAEKIGAYMYKADQFLKGGDLGNHQLGLTNTASLNVRSEPMVSDNIIYQFPKSGTSVAIIKESSQTDGLWYQIVPKKSRPAAYIYGEGKYGTLAKKINVAK
ncbi:S-layer homology domain-containing protein [Pseudalkalibacillus salsuginis]|uniref:S-layer homology domain-containing protein n=1 Tax=Pseudalkalibacillus salsuginis TaxID=2910972 RepID=UPI001F219BD2|nr:S-layer homology domain-containing protein [Pseudalkalibacillus salsuginis]MCF6410109.1 S-layer homology domain-containing protein [Pseudalkalibacillus salsuginis]